MKRYIFCVGFLISVLLLWPLYQGKLWLIDDHEIINFNTVIEKSDSGVFQSLRAGLAETEIARWGQSGRYRPAYYSWHVLRTYLFGINSRAWFLCNCLFFFFSIIYVGLSITYFYPPPFVYSGMLLFAALPCYAGIWGRLGPNEIDACLWTTLFIYGFARYIKHYRFAWVLMCFSAFMAVGSKENFVLLLLPLSIMLVLEIRKKGMQWGNISLFLLPLGMSIIVWSSIISWVSKLPQAVDMYGQSLSLLARTKVFLRFFYEGQRASVVIASFVLFYCLFCFARNKMQDAKNSFLAMLVIATCILGNFVFHNGATSLLSRYAYMEQLFCIVLFVAALFPLRNFLCELWRSSNTFRKHVLRWSYVLGLLSLVSILTLSRFNYFQVQRTLEFDTFLNQVKDYDNVQIINLGPSISSYEPYFSLKRFAEAGLTPNVYYFPVWTPTDNAFWDELKNSLMREAAADKAPPLAPETALVEFSPNVWYRIIEHSSSHREIDQTILINGWQEERSRWDELLGIYPPDKGRRSAGNIMTLALPVDEPQACKVTVSAVPFDTYDVESEAVFYFNGTEVKRAKLKDYVSDFNFEVSQDLAMRSPLHSNLMLLEVRIENAVPEKLNGLIFYSIDIVNSL